MKKSLFFALLAALLVSCGVTVTDYTVVIRNDSSKNVTFDYNDAKDTIAPGISATYTVRAYTSAPSNISVPGAQSVKMSSTREEYVFENVLEQPLTLTITNTLPRAITIKAGEWMEDATGTKTEITVPAASTGVNGTVTNAKIYTRTPYFEIVGNTGGSVQCDWEIPDTAPNTMTVTIK